jgi:hypothetical protein
MGVPSAVRFNVGGAPAARIPSPVLFDQLNLYRDARRYTPYPELSGLGALIESWVV